MKYVVLLLVFFVPILYLVSFSMGKEAWEEINGIKESDIREIAIDPYNRGVVYAAGTETLYRTEDNGISWKAVFSIQGDDEVINFIGVCEQSVLVCTKKGVFRSNDGRAGWKRVFKAVGENESDASHLVFLKDGRIFLATNRGLFLSSDNGITWERDSGAAGRFSIRWIGVLDDIFFLACEKGVYKNSGAGWKRTFVTASEDVETDTDVTDETIEAVKPVNSILISKDRVFLASDSGIFVSEDKGETWKRFVQDGLLSLHINRLLFKDALYTATDKGVFVFSDKEKMWKILYKGMKTNQIWAMDIGLDGYLWVATKKGIYRVDLKNVVNLAEDSNFLIDKKSDVLGRFDNEPNIRDIQNAAIEYAEVHPDKIHAWREEAKRKAILPKVSVGIDESEGDYYYAGTWRGKEGDTGWDLSLTWDLGDLIWNSDQTTIDTRSKLMVQLREDIMDEVTRTYFERRRLQIEMLVSPPADLKLKLEKELRLQELTADIDALTGGYFSRQISYEKQDFAQ